jgi:zinc transport system substrate-binding protein
MRYIIIVCITLILIGSGGCRRDQASSGRIITVSILPQKYLVEKICGTKFSVQVLLPPGANHETYEPTPLDMATLERANLYFAIGYLDFEMNWLPRFVSARPGLKVFNTSEGIKLIEGHHDEHQHSGRGTDPHTWLSPDNCKIQAQNITSALVDYDSVNTEYYMQNLARFKLIADSVDTKIRSILASCPGKPFLIFHPALAYFAREYGLEQISIEFEGKEPSAAKIRELIDTARKKNIRTIFISKEFDTRNAEAIAQEINAKVIVFDPMAADWPGNLIHLAELIAENQ